FPGLIDDSDTPDPADHSRHRDFVGYPGPRPEATRHLDGSATGLPNRSRGWLVTGTVSRPAGRGSSRCFPRGVSGVGTAGSKEDQEKSGSQGPVDILH
ncbi:MAG: hypothetical protein ACOCW6_08365, partial [Spirochaetota bacterium]